ncbi:hypothetical protein C8Q77DRAFT_1159161 [Trametes polyzona]|nr:hypothetical protein C8Q77DRAFT_1159161 [Trametes polyzona]
MSSNDLWQAAVVAQPLPPIPEAHTSNQSRPPTPSTPSGSARPMSLVQSPGHHSSHSGIAEAAIEMADTSGSSELYDVPAGTLATWGVMINRRLKVFISVKRDLLDDIVKQENILNGWPEIPTGKPVEFEGLERKWGIGCPVCPMMFQHVKSGLHSPSADYLIAMRKELDTRPPLPAADLDHRHISPWHITTRWLQYLEGKDVRQMRALIEPPKESDQVFYLIACTRRYMEAAYDLILQSSEVCLQILNTDTQTE